VELYHSSFLKNDCLQGPMAPILFFFFPLLFELELVCDEGNGGIDDFGGEDGEIGEGS
jgi:hypothetical protein